MSLDDIRQAKDKTIGTNQTLKALKQSSGQVGRVYVARDAERHVIEPVVQMAEQAGIPVEWVDSMKQLGKACGIDVGAATASVLVR